MVAGPDGNVWFTERDGNRIGSSSPTGIITEFTVPTINSVPWAIAEASGGEVWFTEFAEKANRIGRLTPGGRVQEFGIPTPASNPSGIVVQDTNTVWFVENAGHHLSRLDRLAV
jgi:virginiamycin B lyase